VSTAAVEAAAQFATRPGFDLVAFREVGLPVYRVNLLTVVMIEKELPALQEFALRALEIGFETPAAIAEFLGLEERDLDEALYVLVADRFLALGRDSGDGADKLTLTQRGKDALAGFRMTQAEERTYVVDYDGLLRRPVRHRGWAMRERALRDLGAIPIPPSPPRRPAVTDLDFGLVETALREARVLGKGRTLLELVRVARAETFFVPATMLVFRAQLGDEVQAAFVIDGRLSEAHGLAFAEAQGPARLGLLTDGDGSLQAAAADVLGRRTADRALEEVRFGDQDDAAGNEADVLDQDQLAKTYELLETFDHPRYLQEALESASSRLVIVSPWIKRRVVNDSFLGNLRRLLDRGVDVFIGFGFGADGGDDDQDAVRGLERLAKEFPRLTLRRFGDSHSKVLIRDEAYAIIGSFNWLSFVGDPDRTFRDERSLLVRRPEVVTEAGERILSRFAKNA
jgi:hypothetical protein